MTVDSWHTRNQTFQLIVDKFAEASQLFGLTISLGKTEVPYQPTSIAVPPPSISIDDRKLKTVESFKYMYLASVISNDGSLDKDISTRVCMGSPVCTGSEPTQHKAVYQSKGLQGNRPHKTAKWM